MPESIALIPADALSLGAAYEALVERLDEGSIRLPDFDDDDAELLAASKRFEDSVPHDPEAYAEIASHWHSRKIANLFLRTSLENGDLTALVRDPRNGTILQIGRDGWVPARWREAQYVPSGIWSDFISNDFYDALGPRGTNIASASQPVFFLKSEFNGWLSKFGTARTDQKNSRGRPPGTGSYRALDERLYDKMLTLIVDQIVTSTNAAAQRVVSEAAGHGVEDSKIRRLVDGYKMFARLKSWPIP